MPCKNDEKCFLFYLKSSFCSQDIQMIVLTFGHVETALISKIRSTLKIMKSQTGQQTIAIHTLLIISGRKDNQTMKFGKLVGRT